MNHNQRVLNSQINKVITYSQKLQEDITPADFGNDITPEQAAAADKMIEALQALESIGYEALNEF